VIAFGSTETEKALFENWIAAIPKRQRNAQTLVIVANTSDAIFSPAIRAGTRMIVREVIPGSPEGAVIFPGISPGSLPLSRAPSASNVSLVL